MNDPYVLSIIAKGYRLRFTSPPLLLNTTWEIRLPKGSHKIQGMREQISLMLQRTQSLRYLQTLRVLFERIPGKQGFWRVASSNRLKTTEQPHRCSSLPLPHAHHKLSA